MEIRKVKNYLGALRERTEILEKRIKEHEEGEGVAAALIKETIRQIGIEAVNML